MLDAGICSDQERFVPLLADELMVFDNMLDV